MKLHVHHAGRVWLCEVASAETGREIVAGLGRWATLPAPGRESPQTAGTVSLAAFTGRRMKKEGVFRKAEGIHVVLPGCSIRIRLSGSLRAEVLYRGKNAMPALMAALRLLSIDAVMNEGGLALHASSVRLGGAVLLFAGPAGSGKTTAAAAFPPSDRLDDDMALIAERAGVWTRLDAFDARDPRRFGPGDVGELPVRALFLPFPAAAFTTEVLKGAAAVKACIHTPPKVLWQKGTAERVLDAASRLSAKVPIVKLGWSPRQNLPLLLSNFLENSRGA